MFCYPHLQCPPSSVPPALIWQQCSLRFAYGIHTFNQSIYRQPIQYQQNRPTGAGLCRLRPTHSGLNVSFLDAHRPALHNIPKRHTLIAQEPSVLRQRHLLADIFCGRTSPAHEAAAAVLLCRMIFNGSHTAASRWTRGLALSTPDANKHDLTPPPPLPVLLSRPYISAV